MKVLLFDWTAGGHHPMYVRRFAEAFGRSAEVAVAAPASVLEEAGTTAVENVNLGDPRPDPALGARLHAENRRISNEELDLFATAIQRTRPDHAIHLYADPILRRLVQRSFMGTKISICVFRPRVHNPSAYGTSIGGPREVGRAWFLEWLIWRWRRRRDAGCLFTLDEAAAARWGRSGGPGSAAAYWMPEPPVLPWCQDEEERERHGCVLFGALAPRKGVESVVRAGYEPGEPLPLILAGDVELTYQPELDAMVEQLRARGHTVETRLWRHSEPEVLGLLADARVALLPYPRHFGMSRVLLESASVGTPVIVHDHGQLAALVRRYRLGRVVDCQNPRALRGALNEMHEARMDAELRGNLRRFADRYSGPSFHRHVVAPILDGRRDETSRRRGTGVAGETV